MNRVEVLDEVSWVEHCIECGDELLEERAELGYRYCS